MKKFNSKEEIARMEKMYNANIGVHEKMDLQQFAFNYYSDQLKKFQKLVDFWDLKEKKPKKRIVVKIKKPTN